jgi:hypothetical protein
VRFSPIELLSKTKVADSGLQPSTPEQHVGSLEVAVYDGGAVAVKIGHACRDLVR